MSFISEQQIQQITQAVAGLNPAQLAWVSGYLSGLSAQAGTRVVSPKTGQTVSKVTVLYGTQTGNSRKLAESLKILLASAGHEVVLSNMKDYRTTGLKKETTLFAVISTHGNGEAPDEALAFFRFLNSERAPRLDGLSYSVLALGDSSYDEFCQTGRELDERLAALGATRLIKHVECDVDYHDDADAWQHAVLEALTLSSGEAVSSAPVAKSTNQYGERHPFAAEVLNVINLTAAGSEKEVFHLELSLEDSGLVYEPGDILALAPFNQRGLVNDILRETGLKGEAEVRIKGDVLSLYDALHERCEVASVTRKVAEAYAVATSQPDLLARLKDKAELVSLIHGGDVLDLVTRFPAKIEPQVLIDALRPLQPRQYSIASSLQAHPDEVHLLIKRVEYRHEGRSHLGVASNWVADLTPGSRVPVYVKPNPGFKLPADAQSKLIMIGPGTGVAPFRAFLADRDARGVVGNTWLFFGEQHFRSDFLYQTEWQQFKHRGSLERISLAWSRDQAEKVYVQDRLLEAAEDVYRWIEAGAYVYVCGDMNHMAKDVNAALLQILCEQGEKTPAQAEEALEVLITSGRYQRDVY